MNSGDRLAGRDDHADREGAALRVLVNALPLRVGGGATYIVEQLGALSTLPGLDITVLATTEVADQLTTACSKSVRVQKCPKRRLPVRLLHEQCVLPLIARGYDVVYQPGGFAMFGSPRPQVVTNQNPHHFGPVARSFAKRAGYPWMLRAVLAAQWRAAHASVRRAEAFVTTTSAFRSDVEGDLGSRDNLHVLRSGATPMPDATVLPEDLGVMNSYALTVANDYIHKDWDGLIRAFQDHPDLPPLVLAGEVRDEERRTTLERRTSRSKGRPPSRVTLLGSVPDRGQIAALYKHAQCFVAHSLLEAGPLTPGEALRQGVRLVASDIPPHRDAAGDRAYYYDAHDPNALAEAVRTALRAAPSTPIDEEERTWADNAEHLARLMHSIAR